VWVLHGGDMTEFAQCTTVNECIKLRDELNNSGKIAQIKTLIKTASKEEKKDLGQELNRLQRAIRQACDAKIQQIQKEQEKDAFMPFDPTFSSGAYQAVQPGNLHPITQIMHELVSIFTDLGFDIADGPLVENQWFNFTALNTPDYHPARQMQDTFFLQDTDKNGEKLVMRTQTSGVQIRYGSAHTPPFRVVCPGVVYRNEDIDATHDINFHQMEGLVVDKHVSLSHLATLLEQAFTRLYKTAITVRMRPSYFPFVNPGVEVDISNPFKDDPTNKLYGQEWIEVLGAGLVHPEVIKNMGLDPQQWQGLAFGFGIDRMVQLKFKISGITQFYNGHLEFLNGEG